MDGITVLLLQTEPDTPGANEKTTLKKISMIKK